MEEVRTVHNSYITIMTYKLCLPVDGTFLAALTEKHGP